MKKKHKFNATITKEEIQQKPLIQFSGNIHLIDGSIEAHNAIEELRKHNFIGFDTETKPTFKKGYKNKIAILQLSTGNDAFIFRLFKYFPVEITEILESEKIIKLGVAIRDDLSGIQKYRKFIPQGFIDIQEYVKQFNIESNGLKKLAGIVLGSRISKSQQTSNWENDVLTEAQLIYAATDAWICLEIFKKLNTSK